LLDQGSFKRFLRPEFGAFLLMGLLLLLAMLAAMAQKPASSECGHGQRGSGALARLAKLLLLLLPLVFLLNASNAVLDVKAYMVRSTGEQGAGSSVAKNKPSAPLPEPSLLELASDPRAYEGKRLSVVGVFFRDKDTLKSFGPDGFVVFRFAVLCCAADARPLAIAARAKAPVSFENGQWIEASGTLNVEERNGALYAILEEAEAKMAKAPENPYLYP